MFDVVAPNQHKLALAVESEGVNKAKPRLPGPPARDSQPVREHHAINDRDGDQRGDPTSRQNADLDDAAVAEREIIQPLHVISIARAARRPAHRRGDSRIAPSRPSSVVGRAWTDEISNFFESDPCP